MIRLYGLIRLGCLGKIGWGVVFVQNLRERFYGKDKMVRTRRLGSNG
jgi:hypothetical protein